MKNLLFSLLFMFCVLNIITAQSNIYFENETTESVFTLEDGPLLETKFFEMTNENEDTVVVDWLITLDVPQAEVPYNEGEFRNAWLVLVCDELVCHSFPNAQTVIPPQATYNWKLNISGNGFLGYELLPGEGTATFEAIDIVNQEQVARFTATIKINDTSIDIVNFYDDKISVYPSPVSDFANIKITENTAIEQLSISNLAGANLLTKSVKQGNSFETIDLSEQPNGVYLFTFKDENGIPIYQKRVNKK